MRLTSADAFSSDRRRVTRWTAKFHELCVDNKTQEHGKKGQAGGGDKSEAVELLCEIDQVSDDRAKGHNSQSNKHVQGGIELREILLWLPLKQSASYRRYHP